METKLNIIENKKSQNMFNRIMKMLRLMKHRKVFIALSFFEILRGFFMVQGQAWGMKWITEGAVNRDSKILFSGIILLTLTVGLATLAVILIEYNSNKITINTKSDIRKLIIDSALKSNFGSFTKFNPGDLVYRLNNNVNDISQLYRSLYFFIGSFGKVVGSLIVGFALSWRLSIIMIILGFLKIWADKIIVKPLQGIASNIKTLESKLLNEVLEYIKGSIFFRMFGNEDKVFNHFAKANKQFGDENLREAKVSANAAFIMQIFEFGALIIVLAVGSILVINKLMDVGSLTAFIALYDHLINPYRFIGDFMKNYKLLNVSYNRVDEVIGFEKALVEKRNDQPSLINTNFSLVADNIAFGYSNENMILENLALKANSGEITYITGKSGTGKTTLFKTLMGFNKPAKGSIYIDADNTKFPASTGLFTYISQTPFLFNGSIRENILLQDSSMDEESLIEACKKAGIYDFILSLPQGFDTLINDGGKQLSGGQKCRISLARAFYSPTPVILLDEIFASLDNNTIELIQESIDELASENRCVLMISHRHEWISPGARVIEIV